MSNRPINWMRRITVAVSLATAASVSLMLSGCRPTSGSTTPKPSAAGATAPAPASTSASPPGDSGIQFVDVAEEAGLDYRWQVQGKRPLNILQTIGNGCAFLDYDRDGNLDILLVGSKSALFRGDGRGKFTDVSAQTGIGNLSGHLLGCAVGDYDNDGFPDIYLSAYRGGILLSNRQGKRFTDVTKAAGVKPQPWGTSCAFADVDGDGWLDLYVANYVEFGPDTDPQLCEMALMGKSETVLSSCGPRYYEAAHKGALFHNQKGRRFADVTRAWGAHTHTGKGLGVAFAPFDSTGRIGFAVANDEVAGDLFQNEGKGKLTNIGVESGTAFDRDGSAHGGMGIDWGDFNNDGRLDLFVGTFQNEAKSLYRNEGDGLFTDVSYDVGISQPALPYVTFGTKFLDADNDGWLDLILANGHVQDNIELIEKATYRQKTLFLRNREGMYEDHTAPSGLDALPPIVGRGLAVGDYDNDGKMDALVVDSEGRPLLLHNRSRTDNRWVGFVVEDTGPGASREGFGALVRVTANGKTYLRLCHADGSYLSASDPRVHVGLGSGGAATVEKVAVRWPDGKEETWQNVPAGRYLRLRRGQAPR